VPPEPGIAPHLVVSVDSSNRHNIGKVVIGRIKRSVGIIAFDDDHLFEKSAIAPAAAKPPIPTPMTIVRPRRLLSGA